MTAELLHLPKIFRQFILFSILFLKHFYYVCIFLRALSATQMERYPSFFFQYFIFDSSPDLGLKFLWSVCQPELLQIKSLFKNLTQIWLKVLFPCLFLLLVITPTENVFLLLIFLHPCIVPFNKTICHLTKLTYFSIVQLIRLLSFVLSNVWCFYDGRLFLYFCPIID